MHCWWWISWFCRSAVWLVTDSFASMIYFDMLLPKAGEHFGCSGISKSVTNPCCLIKGILRNSIVRQACCCKAALRWRKIMLIAKYVPSRELSHMFVCCRNGRTHSRALNHDESYMRLLAVAMGRHIPGHAMAIVVLVKVKHRCLAVYFRSQGLFWKQAVIGMGRFALPWKNASQRQGRRTLRVAARLRVCLFNALSQPKLSNGFLADLAMLTCFRLLQMGLAHWQYLKCRNVFLLDSTWPFEQTHSALKVILIS